MNSTDGISPTNESKRDFLKWVLSGGLVAFAGSVLYPLLAYLKPPAQGEVEVSSVKVGKLADIQKDSGQTVISTGPYRYVRHPLYTSVLLLCLGSAFLLGSWIGVILGLLFVGMFARRAVGEERVLQKGLKGYDAYMAQVRWRLIPHVW